ncbi:hypothetical protein MLD38_014818 [Melastoma candidum]|uniref:Uncharacterized protein n=1 Tax=Melastoma candidum TaxID=119954 RepID=A0ACB9REJ7_9MYRT|nr:hypothetical protein MLD38_014818 [Melastoma candidum]
MASREKPRKGFLTFYRSITGSAKPNHVPRAEEIVLPAAVPVEYLASPQVRPRRSSAAEGEYDYEGTKRSVDGRGGGGGAEKGYGDHRGRFVEGRKSVSYVETASPEAVARLLQAKVMVCDMPGFMQVHAFRCARMSFDGSEKFSSKYMAHSIKKEFDKVYGPAWHCIVGSNFGSFVTHSTGCFLYFSMDKLYILLFKTKVKKTPGS